MMLGATRPAMINNDQGRKYKKILKYRAGCFFVSLVSDMERASRSAGDQLGRIEFLRRIVTFLRIFLYKKIGKILIITSLTNLNNNENRPGIMMKKAIPLLFFAASVFASTMASAADSTELKVKGTIQPPACQPQFTGGNVIDYGTIPARSLAAGAYTRLATKGIPLVITCNQAVKMALRVSDNRSASALTGALPQGANFAYGLGAASNGKSIGVYTVHLPANRVVTDGVAATQIYSTDGNKTWAVTEGSGQFGADRSMSWSNAGGVTPAAFVTVSGVILVAPRINKPEELPLTQDIPLDGSATIEVVYL